MPQDYFGLLIHELSSFEAADTFVFVISPDSNASKVCSQGINHAMANNKRLLPIVWHENFEQAFMHPALNRHNWLFFQEKDDFDNAFASLVEILNTDLDHVKTHTGCWYEP